MDWIVKLVKARRDNRLFLIRLQFFGGRIAFHVFLQPDLNCPHDHPFSFFTLILWRGYIDRHHPTGEYGVFEDKPLKPFRVYYRPSHYTHTVLLKHGKPSVSVIFSSKMKWKNIGGIKVLDFRFLTPSGWRHQIKHPRKYQSCPDAAIVKGTIHAVDPGNGNVPAGSVVKDGGKGKG